MQPIRWPWWAVCAAFSFAGLFGTGCSQARDSSLAVGIYDNPVGGSSEGGASEAQPCTLGAKLNASCDPCVAAICQAIPSCCNVRWTQACTDAVAPRCGQTCPCSADAQPGPDMSRCYHLDEVKGSWKQAQARCRARGAGWDRTTLSSSLENAFVQKTGEGDSAWIGPNDLQTDGAWEWSDGSPVAYSPWRPGEPTDSAITDCVAMDGSGYWSDNIPHARRTSAIRG